MKKTYTEIKGNYYDNLDKIIDWGDQINVRYYDPEVHRALEADRR